MVLTKTAPNIADGHTSSGAAHQSAQRVECLLVLFDYATPARDGVGHAFWIKTTHGAEPPHETLALSKAELHFGDGVFDLLLSSHLLRLPDTERSAAHVHDPALLRTAARPLQGALALLLLHLA